MKLGSLKLPSFVNHRVPWFDTSDSS